MIYKDKEKGIKKNSQFHSFNSNNKKRIRRK